MIRIKIKDAGPANLDCCNNFRHILLEKGTLGKNRLLLLRFEGLQQVNY